MPLTLLLGALSGCAGLERRPLEITTAGSQVELLESGGAPAGCGLLGPVQASRGALQNPELLDIALRNDAAELGGNLVVITERTTLSAKGEVHLCQPGEQAQPAAPVPTPDPPTDPRAPALMHASTGSVQDSSLDGRARELFVLGRDAYLQKRYEDALRYFKAAHSLSGRYELQYNIGQAADRLQRSHEALSAFDAYLEQAPAGELRSETEARAEVLRGEIVPRAPH